MPKSPKSRAPPPERARAVQDLRVYIFAAPFSFCTQVLALELRGLGFRGHKKNRRNLNPRSDTALTHTHTPLQESCANPNAQTRGLPKNGRGCHAAHPRKGRQEGPEEEKTAVARRHGCKAQRQTKGASTGQMTRTGQRQQRPGFFFCCGPFLLMPRVIGF